MGHRIPPLSLEVTCNQKVGTFENIKTFENLGTFFILILIHMHHIFKNLGTYVVLINECKLYKSLFRMHRYSDLKISSSIYYHALFGAALR